MRDEWCEGSNSLISMRTKQYMDLDTGERINVKQVDKKFYGAKQFWKIVLMDFLNLLGAFQSKQVDVFLYVIMNTNPGNNLFIGTYKKIAAGAGVTPPTVWTAMKKMQEHNFAKLVQNGVWAINPEIIMKGDPNKQNLLISYYNESRPRNKDLPEKEKEQEKQSLEDVK